MSEDFISEIDEILSEELPDNPEEVPMDPVAERKEEIIDILQYAAEEIGRSPSLRQFNSLDLETSGYVIARVFGSWNNAKREAGLEVYEMGDGKYATTPINEDYFKEVDSPEKAYWLGTLIASSSLNFNPNLVFSLGRVLGRDYFVKEFSQTIESEYEIYSIPATRRNSQDSEIVQTQINNQTFIENLLSAGYPGPDEETDDLPNLSPKLRAPFVRGYLESNRHFWNGWSVVFDNPGRAEQLRDWFEAFGAKRPTLGESNGKPTTRVANVFDIKAIFETCWPDGLSTEPSFTPYPKRILEYLESEYPYPENVVYLSE